MGGLSGDHSMGILRVGIIGGGMGGSKLLGMLAGSQACEIIYIVDKRANAPAFAEARNRGIITATALNKTIESFSVDLIIEATGSGDVVAEIKKHMAEGTELMSSRIALMLFTIMKENREIINREIIREIIGIREKIQGETRKSRNLLAAINDIFKSMRIMSFNAGVEAARAGAHGKGFNVLAQEVKNIADRTQALTKDMDTINQGIEALSKDMEDSLKNLS